MLKKFRAFGAEIKLFLLCFSDKNIKIWPVALKDRSRGGIPLTKFSEVQIFSANVKCQKTLRLRRETLSPG